MQNIESILADELALLITDITQRHIAAGQRVTGRTISTLESEVHAAGDAVVGYLSGAPYFGVLDKGSGPFRKKGSDQERKQFIDSLAEWCRARGFPDTGLSPEQYIAAAKRLKWYIGKYGSKTYRDKSRQDKVITPAVAAFQTRVGARVSSLLETQIRNKFFKLQ